MSQLKIALLQMTSYGVDQDANLAKGEEYCRRAAAMGADIALFPEMWSIGYTFYDPNDPGDKDRWRAQAIDHDNPFILHFRGLAQQLNMAIAITYLERWPVTPRNAVSLIDRHGQILMTY